MKRYRMLKKGERLKEGDEWLKSDGEWLECLITIGQKVTLMDEGQFRRPLKPNKKKRGGK